MEREKWEDLVHAIRDEVQNGYLTLLMLETGDLKVSRDPIDNRCSLITSEMPEYHAIMEVVGPLEPGNFLNRHKYVGKGLSPMADDLRYIGKVPDDVAKSSRIFANLSGTGILTRITEPPSMVLESDQNK
jgi:hypothetical protein